MAVSTNSRTATIHNPRYRRLVNRLITIRKIAGISQQQLASEIGLSQSDISKVERCERRLDFAELYDWLFVLVGAEVTGEIAKILEDWNEPID